MILNLPKETCGCCKKFISIGQTILECDKCDMIIHGKCYKKTNFSNIDSLWLCESCANDHEPHYNPFRSAYSAASGNNEAFYDEDPSDYIDTLQIMSTLLDKCKSYNKIEFNNMISEIQVPENTSLFSSYFLNIDGNTSNFDELMLELNQTKEKFSVIGLAETNTDSCNKDLYQLPNYKSFYQDKKPNKKKGTGVAIYVHDSLNATLDNTHTMINDHIETIFITITNTKEPITVGSIYRPPSGDLSKFVEILAGILDTLPQRPVYLMGDYNIDLLNLSGDLASKYEQLLLTSNIMPLLSIHTHEMPGCKKSCIDNILSNNFENVVVSGTIKDSLSHHLPIFQISLISQLNSKNEMPKYTQYYNFSKLNLDLFVNELQESLSKIEPSENNFSEFQEIFTGTMDRTCKLEIPKTSIRNNINKPWITDGLISAIQKKHKYHEDWKKTVSKNCPGGNVEMHEKFKAYRKTLNKTIKYTKNQFYCNKFVECKGDSKKTWQIINQVRGKSKRSIKPLFNIDNKRITDRRMIANAFNEYFTSVAEKMNADSYNDTEDANATNAEMPSFLDYMNKSCSSSIFLRDCDSDEVLELIQGLENGKASDIPIKVIKRSGQVISPILAKYFNLLMQKGHFPDTMKVGKITPIFKKGCEENFENYRPVSTLPLFGKLFEKIIYSRLYSFLIAKGILNENQFGFRKAHSTSHALNFSVNEIRKSLANEEHVIGVFIDLSKAFDTISHSKLLAKLEKSGIRGSALSLFTSYLADRTQYTNVLGVKSDKLRVKFGVPQGSVLGPLLFLLYINDIMNCSKLGIFVLFADDTNIFIKGTNLADALQKANEVLKFVQTYMRLNELHINMSKCCFMHFDPRKRQKMPVDNISEILLQIDGVPIKQVSSTRFLGVVIDEKLSWKEHIEYLTRKLKCQVGAINRIKDCVPGDLHRDLYYTLFESHLSYCIDVWGGVSSNKINPLFVVQKQCLRILFGDKEKYLDKFETCARCRPCNEQILGEQFYRKEPSKPLFTKNKIMTVQNIYNYHCFMDVLKILKLRTPISLFSEFNLSDRKETLLLTPTPDTDFIYKSSILWNSLRIKLHILDFSVKISCLKSKIKSLILSVQQSHHATEWSAPNFEL